MSDIYTLADEFFQLSTDQAQIKLAGRVSKKLIVKKLEKDRGDYNDLRMSVEQKEKALQDLNEALDRDRKAMSACRSDVLKAYDVLKNMDLLDIQEVKMMADDVGYVKNKRIFRLQHDDDGNITLVPFKKKRDEEDELDEELDADDLLASLVD